MQGRAMNERPFDVVIYGATGFTGRQAAQYFAAHAPKSLRWAIAGRSEAKLRDILSGLARPEVGSIVADSASPESVFAMCAKTRVVLTTAGPFALYGTPVVEGCVRARTHYVDITGETFWVHEMIERFHAQAVIDGTKIVPFCGYDSVPSDLGAYLMVRALEQRGEACLRVEGFHSGRGGLNGGTLATMLNQYDSGHETTVADPFLLNPPEAPANDAARRASTDVKGVFYHDVSKRWAAPFVMGLINTRVVRRSAALHGLAGRPYGNDFSYQEYWRSGNMVEAAALAAGIRLTTALARRQFSRRWFQKLGPPPGAGPSEKTMDSGFFKSEFFACGEKGTKVSAMMSGQGDPGNRATVRFLCESALALALDEAELPKQGGVLTPATAFPEVLLRRLQERGVRWEVRA